MRFMVMIKATKDSEAGVPPDEKILSEMMKYNEELMKAGVLLAGEGLQPSSKGARIRFSGDKRTVVDGPFAETKEQLAGYYIIECENLDEAIEWASKIPTTCKGGEGCIEIRPIADLPYLCAMARAEP